MKKNINIGIIGVGKISDLHIQGYKNMENVEVAGIADINQKTLKQKARFWEVKKTTLDYRDLLEDKKIDVIDILTPHNLHSKIFIEALKSGKHVSVQKPMAISDKECQAMIDESIKSDKKSRVFDNFLYYPPYIKAKDLIKDGAIGEIKSVRLKSILGYSTDRQSKVNNWRFNEKINGGGKVLFDYGYHIFSVAYDLMGDIVKISSFVENTEMSDGSFLDCPGIIMWNYENQNHGSWDIVRAHKIKINSDYFNEDEWFEITGTEGFIWINRCSGKILDGPPLICFSKGEINEITFPKEELDWGSSFNIGMKNFVDSIGEDFNSKLSPSGGMKIFNYCKAARLSSDQQKPVSLIK